MNRWLAHERYRPLAIAPDGFVDPYGITRQPMTIEPGNPGFARARPRAAGRAAAAVHQPPGPRRARRGVGAARRRAWTTSWPGSRTLRALPELEGREMLMWGDMVSGRVRPRRAGCPPASRCASGATTTGIPSTSAARSWPRRGRAVLGRARDLELAEHPGPAHQRRGPPAAGRPRRPSPTAARATSTPTGATTATSSSR